MAISETLDSFDFGTSSVGSRKGKWNWDEMLAKHSDQTGKVGKETLGAKGTGDPTPATLQFMLRKQAAKRGLGIQISVKGQEVYYKALVLDESRAAKVKADYEAKQAKWAESSKSRKTAANGTAAKKDLADEFVETQTVTEGVTEAPVEQTETQEDEPKGNGHKQSKKQQKAAARHG